MNAAVAQGVEPAQIAQHYDSVSLCFSRGMGALAGAVLAGCREFVAKAWHVRKLLGRGMGQVGVLAAAAHLRLQQVEVTLHRDHNAWSFAEHTSGPLSVLGCNNTPGTAQQYQADCQHLAAPLVGHRLCAPSWYHNISARDTDLARRKLEFVARKCQEELALRLHPTPPALGEPEHSASPFVLQMCSLPSEN
uniref:Aromatic amino acid beta-eliminating lyase/threonine aldolase domain-containing protein n=1 Tax=Taeniopygia guttata TaxID=59729 RepID=H0YYR9_TAEGU